jgi:hypothetical protein
MNRTPQAEDGSVYTERVIADSRKVEVLHLGSWGGANNTSPLKTSFLQNFIQGPELGRFLYNDLRKGKWARHLARGMQGVSMGQIH